MSSSLTRQGSSFRSPRAPYSNRGAVGSYRNGSLYYNNGNTYNQRQRQQQQQRRDQGFQQFSQYQKSKHLSRRNMQRQQEDTTECCIILNGVREITCVALDITGLHLLVGTRCGKLLSYDIVLNPASLANRCGYSLDARVVAIEWVPPTLSPPSQLLALVALPGGVLLLDMSSTTDVVKSVNFQSPEGGGAIISMHLAHNGLLSLGYDTGDLCVFNAIPILNPSPSWTPGSMVQSLPLVRRRFPSAVSIATGCKSVLVAADRAGAVLFKSTGDVQQRAQAGLEQGLSEAAVVEATNRRLGEVDVALEMEGVAPPRARASRLHVAPAEEQCLAGTLLCCGGMQPKSASPETCPEQGHILALATSRPRVLLVYPQAIGDRARRLFEAALDTLGASAARYYALGRQTVSWGLRTEIDPYCIFTDGEFLYLGGSKGAIVQLDPRELRETWVLSPPSSIQYGGYVTAGDIVISTPGSEVVASCGRTRIIAWGASSVPEWMEARTGQSYGTDFSEVWLKVLM